MTSHKKFLSLILFGALVASTVLQPVLPNYPGASIWFSGLFVTNKVLHLGFDTIKVAWLKSLPDPINLAIWLANPGGQVFIPPGTESISSAINITKNNIHLIGAGQGVTVISNTHATNDSLVIGDGSIQYLNFTISDLTITSTTPTTGSAIRIRKAGRVYLDRLQILSHGRGVFADAESFDIFLSSSRLRANKIGILLDQSSGGSGFFGQQLVINKVGAPASNQGIVLTNASGYWFDQVDIRASDNVAILFNPGASDSVLHGWFTDVLADSSTSNGWLLGGSGNIYGVFVQDGWASFNGSTGFEITNSNADGIYLTGFRGIDNDGHGLFLNNTGGGLLSVINSIFSGNSRTTTDLNHGAVVLAGATNFKFMLTRFGPDMGRADSQNTGLLIQTGASDNYQIMGNDFRGNLTAQLTDNGTGTNKQIFGNLPAAAESLISTQLTLTGGRFIHRDPQAFTNADATPSISGGNAFATTGTTTITDFTNGVNGQVIFVRATDTITITDSSGLNLNGAADYVMTVGDTLTLIRMASAWHETARSVN